VQRAGIDFDEVFAPVARLESVRMMVALAAHEGWEVHHMDVKSTFLNGVIEEEVYVQQSPGFSISDRRTAGGHIDQSFETSPFSGAARQDRYQGCG
jgi:hypothetical protein